jgi:hypothetical protein
VPQLFYVDAKPVSPASHKDLYVKTGADYSFAAEVNSVPLAAAELPAAAAEYPIVFAGTGDTVLPIALLGGREKRNLFVDADGKWNARYIPAFVRRYPFVFAQSPDGKSLALCIDEQYPGCNHEGRGERLFDVDGERTAYLNQVLGFLRAYQQQHERTRSLCKKLMELELLVPVQALVTQGVENRQVLGGLRVIDRQKLKALDADTLTTMLKSDELELAFLQLHSLANLRALGEKMPQPTAEATAPDPGRQDGRDNDGTPPVKH